MMRAKVNRQQFASDSVIFKEGEAGDCAYLIEDGTIEISVFQGDSKTVLAKLNKGEIFGEMALIDDELRNATAKALTDTKLMQIPKKYIKTTLDAADPFLNLILKGVLERFRRGYSQYAYNSADPIKNEKLSQSEREQMLHRFQFEEELWRAINESEFRIFLQPIISSKEQKIVGFEALARWQHPERGLLSPAQFIDSLENCEIIVPFGQWVFEEVCRTIYRLKHLDTTALLTDFFVGVNVSSKQFESASLDLDFSGAAKRIGVTSKYLKIEVTETVLMENPQEVQRILEKFKKNGFSIALDDFGTGYSSLSYLHRFPIDTLKIDISFVQTMLDNVKSMHIISATHSLAQKLGMIIVAEGVTTPEQADKLRELGCDYFQGYLYGKPMPLDETVHFIEKYG